MSSTLSGWKWNNLRWHFFRETPNGMVSACHLYSLRVLGSRPMRPFDAEPTNGERVCEGCRAVADAERRIKELP